jgi:hypothetical protein
MKCEKCGAEVKEPFTLRSMQLCEDCYMDLLSPLKSCDPWAVHSARGSMDQGAQVLLPIQQQILDAVTRAGAITAACLAENLGIAPGELERQFATLRHMELLRGFKGDDGKKYLCPFKS